MKALSHFKELKKRYNSESLSFQILKKDIKGRPHLGFRRALI